MSFSPFPKYKFKSLLGMSADFLRSRGIELLMLDLDNTIAPYDLAQPSAEVCAWAKQLQAEGILLFIVSNSKKTHRVSAFADALEIDYIYHARKPSPKKVREVAARFGVSLGACALAGDQIFTDVMAANFAVAASILVRPIKFTNPLLALRYAAEQPFRIWRKEED